MFKRLLFAIVLIVLNSAPSFARDLQYGAMLSTASLFVSDDDGDTETVSDSSIINIFVSGRAFSRDSRWLLGLSTIDDVKFKASVDEVGMVAERMAIEASVQHQLSFSRSFHPYLGGGIIASNSKFTKRHLVDKDGFLVGGQLDDREETTLGIQLNASHEWNVSRHMLLGIHSRYEKSLDDGFNGFTVGITGYYQ